MHVLYNEKYSLKSKRKLRYNIPVPKYKTIAQNKSKRCILKLSHCQISISGNSLKSIVALKNVSFSSTYNMILFYLLICCIFSVIWALGHWQDQTVVSCRWHPLHVNRNPVLKPIGLQMKAQLCPSGKLKVAET